MAQSKKQNGAGTSKLLLWKKNVQNGQPCQYSDIDAVILRRVVDTITRAGGAIMLGVTTDGGAFSVVVLHGDQKIKEYPHGPEELSVLFDALTEEFLDDI